MMMGKIDSWWVLAVVVRVMSVSRRKKRAQRRDRIPKDASRFVQPVHKRGQTGGTANSIWRGVSEY